MKLIEVKLENFRGYKNLHTVKMEDLTVFIGKNDSGKSTVLEALDIFFNKTAPDQTDASVSGDSSNVRIACVFSEFQESLVIDDSFQTTLSNEYLLNEDGNLEIHKIYNCSLSSPKLSKVFAVANHPSNEEMDSLHELTLPKLKALAKKLDVTAENETIKSSFRKAIWESAESLDLVSSEVLLMKESGKSAWDTLQKSMPIYALFKSDRASTDQDSEAQDPMKSAIKEALQDQLDKLQEVVDDVKTSIEAVAQTTIEKINELSPELANQLTPEVKIKNWDTLFSVSLTGDEDIPVNKRGSGVRRLILLSFFRAKAEELAKKESKNGIIYAVEEPETSQHPNNQKMLMDAFQDLASEHGVQIILTTHTPVLVRNLNLETLRYVTKADNEPEILKVDNDNVYRNVADDLGILPDHTIKAFLGVEGKHDIAFLRHLSANLHQEDPTIPNLAQAEDEGKLVFIPLGGSSMDLWFDRLNDLNRPQFYLMDRDTKPPAAAKYQSKYDSFTENGHTAWITSKLELENYIHVDIIKSQQANYTGENDPFEDAPHLLAKAKHEASESECTWDEVKANNEKLKKKESLAKRQLNHDYVKHMTLGQLQEIDTEGQLIDIIKTVGEALNN